MADYWFVFRPDGSAMFGSGIDGDYARFTPPVGYRKLAASQAEYEAGEPDIALVKDRLHAAIDAGAGAVRARFISDIPGQAQTYEKKEREARAWSADADPTGFPFIAAEAAVRGIPMAQVRDEIMAQVEQLIPLAAMIEAHRIAAKQAVTASDTLPAILAASDVDWAALLP